jgi:hypothetical protein
MREETGPKSQRKSTDGALLEMLISEVRRMSISFFRPSSPPRELLSLPFYRLKGRVRFTTKT